MIYFLSMSMQSFLSWISLSRFQLPSQSFLDYDSRLQIISEYYLFCWQILSSAVVSWAEDISVSCPFLRVQLMTDFMRQKIFNVSQLDQITNIIQNIQSLQKLYQSKAMGGQCSKSRISTKIHFYKKKQVLSDPSDSDIIIKVWHHQNSKKLIDYENQENARYYQSAPIPISETIYFDISQGFSKCCIENEVPQQKQVVDLKSGKVAFNFKIYKQQIYGQVHWGQAKITQVIKNQEIIFPGMQIVMSELIFKVKQIISGMQVLELKEEFEQFKSTQHIEAPIEQEKQCKFCYQKSKPHNPLIKPCKCQGSIDCIHRDCITQWIINKNHLWKLQQNIFQQKNIFHLPLQASRCEICHTSYEKFISYQIIKRIIPIETKSEIYAMFEVFNKKVIDKEGKAPTYICYKFDRKNKNMKVGRSKSCDFIPQNSSISKLHAQIVMIGQQLFIKDTKSKYGTGILCKNNELQIDKQYQMEGLYLEFSQKKKQKNRFKKNIIHGQGLT